MEVIRQGTDTCKMEHFHIYNGIVNMLIGITMIWIWMQHLTCFTTISVTRLTQEQ